jgi:type IV pilus assembly protein PilA
MKSFYKSLKRQDGFTLVELMVVVAIIGLLSAVAIPNFKKYQAKAKISEAKLQLSALYTAQASFFSDYNIYHNCLAYMGFDPNPERANRYYAIGIAVAANINGTATTGAYGAAVNSGLNQAQCARNNAAAFPAAGGVPSASNMTWFPAGKGIGASIASTATYIPGTLIGVQAAPGTMTYTAMAGGVISADFTTAANASRLSINELKVISSVMNGF